MSIKNYQKENQTLFKVRVQGRSLRFPEIRITKQLSGFKSHAEADKAQQKLVREIQREVADQEARRAINGQSWSGVLSHWYESQKRIRVPFGNISLTTLDDYYNGIRRRMKKFDQISCSNISTLDLMEVFNQMADEGVSLAHRQKLRTKIKEVFDFGLKAGLVNFVKNPAYELVLKKAEEKKPEILTIGEIRKLIEFAFAKNHDWKHVWAMALLTGMRNGELFALKWSDIDWEQKLITVSRSFNCRIKEIKSTKAGYWRDVPMSNDCIRLLGELKKITGGGEWILPRLSRWDHGIQAAVLRTFCLENNLPSVRFHTLRACFGTQLLRQGVPSAVVMKIAGWKDLKTMQRYIRLAGVEVAGATDKLSVLPPEEVAANVVSFRPRG